ncbi:putative FAD-dependent monooxygenase [Tricladium varicosporioides]|nr:putative FAD-dependent monooxygenase [Hymenoscyphus varicosporioides]
MSPPQINPFRVIVVGGGVGGLTAAHALSKAGIDYVVLEKGFIAPPIGASIGIYPHGSRILRQLGVLQAVADECLPLGKSINLLPNGTAIAKSDFFRHCIKNHQFPIPVLERRAFLQILYDGLDEASKAKVKPGKNVTEVFQDDNGVRVTLQDGTTEEGDLILGCDGVHSNVRNAMWNNANTAIPGMITTAEKKALYCDWTALVGFCPTLPSMSNCDMSCTHYEGKSFLIINQKQWTFFFVFFKNVERLYWPSRPRWTKEDAEKKATSCADCPISDTQVFGELWKNRERGELVNIEEGLFKHMYFGRIVLAGDAVHKMTPNIGLGGNSSMESVVVLANALNKAVKTDPKRKPGKAAIEALLAEYQAERYPRMKKVIEFSGLATKIQAWDNIFYKAVSRIMPYLPDTAFANECAKIIKGAPKLDYVPLPEDAKGLVEWDDEVGTSPRVDIFKSAVTQSQIPLLVLFVLLSSCIYLIGYKS